MAEKKLSRELDVTVQELLEVRNELMNRLLPVNQHLKTAGIFMLCLFGVKLALRLAGSISSLLWGSKLLTAAIMLLVLSRKYLKM